MRRFPLFFLVFAFAFAFTLPACSKKASDDDDDVRPPKSGRTKPPPPPTLEPYKGDSWDGVVRGRVVYQGEPPVMPPIPAMQNHNDKEGCLAGDPFEKVEQKWLLDKNNNVANVVLFFKAPAGKYFALKDEDKARKDKVEMDQPHCAYIPHVLVIFPSYLDGKELKSSGQEFIVKNTARFNHNVSWQGDPNKNSPGNVILKSGDERKLDFTPQPSSPINFKCDIHSWMNAKVWAFDHPYAARTKEDGTFEIKNVPTGATELELFIWHEAGYPSPTKLQSLKIQSGENKLKDIQIQAK